jgi:hypothetical protein
VGRDEPGTVLVVERDRDVVGVGGRGEGVDDGDGHVDRWARVRGPPGDDDAVDAAGGEGAQVVLLADVVVSGVAEQDGHPPRGEHVLGAEQHGDREAAEGVRRDHADRVRTTRRQRATAGVPDEPELRGSVTDTGTGLLAELPGVVEGLRRGADRHPGERGDVGDPDRCASGAAGSFERHGNPLSRSRS